MKKTITFLLLLFFVTTLMYSNTRQGNYRWRDDSVGESTNEGWLAAENTNIYVSGDTTNIRLRTEIYNDEPDFTATNNFSLYYSTDSIATTGTWTKITASSDTFRLSTTSQYDEGNALTDLLTNSESCIHGTTGFLIESSEDYYLSLTNNTSFETEYCLQIDDKAKRGITYYFNMKYSTGSNMISHASLPGLTIKYDQAITFAELDDKTTDDADFDPEATNDLGLDITYESSDETVATIVSGLIHVVGAGTTNITASQAGNDTINAATPVVQELTITESTTGIDDISFTNLKMYPNPAKDILNIELENISISDNIRVSIIDLAGKILLSEILSDSNSKIQLEDYDAGIYFVEIKNTTERKVLKLVIE